MRVEYTCLHCGATFFRRASQAKPGRVKYCSRACKNAAPDGRKRGHPNLPRFPKQCCRCGATFLAKVKTQVTCTDCLVCARCGAPVRDWRQKYCRRACYEAAGYTFTDARRQHLKEAAEHPERTKRSGQARRGKPKPSMRGSGNHNWKGGTYGTERHRDMAKIEYANWRDAVFQRDGYACQSCGAIGVYLNAHHIKPWRNHPELRYDPGNGQTLCVPCHRAHHRLHR